MTFEELFFYSALVAASVFIASGIVAIFMVHWICRSNEMGEETGEFQDFVPGNVEIIREKDYRMTV